MRSRLEIMMERALLMRQHAALSRRFANTSAMGRLFSTLPTQLADQDERLTALDEEYLQALQAEEVEVA